MQLQVKHKDLKKYSHEWQKLDSTFPCLQGGISRMSLGRNNKSVRRYRVTSTDHCPGGRGVMVSSDNQVHHS